MFRKKIATLSLALAMMIGAPTVAPAAEQLESGVWVDTFSTSGSRTGRMAVFFFARDKDGKMEVCGNYYLFGTGSAHRYLVRALNRYRFFYDGSTLFTNASFLWLAPTEEQIGEQILCKLTDEPFAESSNSRLQGRMPFAR
ncbi:MAG: hypothetical protein GQ535_05745 [Rhodobacteraceae bacterium]|nr:hypothetical protein [Paracoccaceae bacterium]